MQQLWAQVLDLTEKGETWRLEPDEKEHIRRINEEHMQIDPVLEMILDKYRWEDFEFVAEWRTATDIAGDLNLKNITIKETRQIAGCICRLNGNQKRMSHGKRLLKIPAIRSALG